MASKLHEPGRPCGCHLAAHLLKVLDVERLHARVGLQRIKHSVQHLGVMEDSKACRCGCACACIALGDGHCAAGLRQASSATSRLLPGHPLLSSLQQPPLPHLRRNIAAKELAQAQHAALGLKLGAVASNHVQELAQGRGA